MAADERYRLELVSIPDAEQPAWLALVVTGRDRRGTDRYDDDPASHYSWDSTVPNRDAVSVGDALILWDSRTLLGVSVIETIGTGTQLKTFARCQSCGGSNVERRRTLIPAYRCYVCKAEFDEPRTHSREVQTYRSEHRAGWIDLEGALPGQQLRELCAKPRSQLSIRSLDWARFVGALRAVRPDLPVTAATSVANRVRHGHREATVRVRIGQGDFRRHLLSRYGSTCAFSGQSPIAALEAAHLYSYATEGRHHDGGGFLLRRDLHRLFDLGLIALDPRTGRLDLADGLADYQQYRHLHGAVPTIVLDESQLQFLRRHWDQHRC